MQFPLDVSCGKWHTIVTVPPAGWLLNRRPELLFRHILPACCGLFVLVSFLAVFGYEHQFHAILQPVTTVVQFVFFVICSVAATGLAPCTDRVLLFACLMYAIQLLLVPASIVWTRAFAFGPGTTILATTILVLVTGSLMRRIRFAVTQPEATTLLNHIIDE